MKFSVEINLVCISVVLNLYNRCSVCINLDLIELLRVESNEACI